MKQTLLFEREDSTDEKKYTKKVESPIYEPKNKQPHVLELYDSEKTKRLLREIKTANISQLEKDFLTEAAKRHTVFNYEKTADYYSHASKEMQTLMEKSALVIIDFEMAIQLGYIRLSDDIRTQYLEEYAQ